MGGSGTVAYKFYLSVNKQEKKRSKKSKVYFNRHSWTTLYETEKMKGMEKYEFIGEYSAGCKKRNKKGYSHHPGGTDPYVGFVCSPSFYHAG